jgi:8-oxo-dGTP diphosphatase
MLEKLEQRLAQGLKLVQLREPAARRNFVDEAIERARRYGCKTMVKWPHPRADGLHLTSAELMKTGSRPDFRLVAASCHTRAELERAMALELDFAVLGPLKGKAGIAPLGWKGFSEIARGTTIPVYAIGGLERADLEDAWRAGAHGVAMIRGAWR